MSLSLLNHTCILTCRIYRGRINSRSSEGIKLIGVCLDGGPAPFIIMPFMANGSLKAYLEKERENILLNPESTSPVDAIVNT